MSTDITSKSSDGDNRSTTGSDESIKNMCDQDARFCSGPAMGVPSVAVGKGIQEFPLEPKVSGIQGGNGPKGFRASDAASEVEYRDPNYSKCGAAR